jgi:hypothetical protein
MKIIKPKKMMSLWQLSSKLTLNFFFYSLLLVDKFTIKVKLTYKLLLFLV